MSWPAGESAFVTGAASGIGLGIARALVDAGAKVALADVDEERLNTVTEELAAEGADVVAVVLDVSDPEQWAAAATAAESAIGPISILCNNAGVNGGGSIDDTTVEVWRWIQRINIDGQFIGVKTFLPRFRERGGRAHIVNTASMGALFPIPNLTAYAATKLASVSFSRNLREEFKETDIGVSVLLPGTVATRIHLSAAELEAKQLGTEKESTAPDAHWLEVLSAGADPTKVGEQVVEAMASRQFYIVTHKEFAPLVRAVHEELEVAFEEFDGRHGPEPLLA